MKQNQILRFFKENGEISQSHIFKKNLQDMLSERIAYIRIAYICMKLVSKLLRKDFKTEFLKNSIMDSEIQILKHGRYKKNQTNE